VSTLTGEVRILQSIQAADAGVVMNPEQCRGQIEGGVAQTIGTALYSESPYNPVAPALANAVRDAIGIRPTELPMSRDRIWRLLHPVRS
jgi:putative selenate reductase molybdopterin-binding subunit